MNEIMSDIAYTPYWVWLVLALLIWRGTKALQPREVGLRGLIFMPTVLVILSLHNLLGQGANAGVLAGLGLGALLGIAMGFTLERRHPPVALGNGKLRLPGEWTQMAVVISIFLTRYTSTVMGITHPDLAGNGTVIMIMAGLSGFFAAMMLTRTLSRLRVAYGNSTPLAT